MYYHLSKEQTPVGSQSDHPHHDHWGHLPGRKHVQNLQKEFENLLLFNDGASQGLLARKRLAELLELQQGGAGLQRFLTGPEAETPLDRVPPSLLAGNNIPPSLSPTLDQNWRVWSWTSVPLAIATDDPW